jgi:uncharacterized membrane protein (UPF0127 family)
MLTSRTLGLSVLACSLTACSSGRTHVVATRDVSLPDGFTVNAELKVSANEMARGMMYRDSLDSGDGMLFVHSQAGQYPYWMANCKFPLDIIWIDSGHKVVEISPKTPPCPSGGSDCPTFGGHAIAQYVLEIGGGEAAKHGVREGAELRF